MQPTTIETLQGVPIQWTCPSCDFDNDEEFTELPETVICGCCGESFDYDDANDLQSRSNGCAECARSFGPWFTGDCDHV